MKKRTLAEVCEYFEMYGAIDKDGYTCLYNSKPAILDNDAWCSTDDNTFLEASRLIEPSECDWKDSLYTPKALRPEYEAYSEPKLEWIDKDIVHKRDKNMACYIDSITRDSCDENVFAIRTDWGTEYTCEQLFKDWTWLDGSIIGKEVKK